MTATASSIGESLSGAADILSATHASEASRKLRARFIGANDTRTDSLLEPVFTPQPYLPLWDAMRDFTARRDADTPDEIWLLNHLPVFTQGQAGKPEHVLNPGTIPVVQIDRGGQVTYHGPGQLIVYLLIDVRRAGTGVRELVENIECSVIDVLSHFGIIGESQRKAPGVYVKGAKIAALGLRIRQGCSYHGLSFNIAMDLSPFRRINPCGYQGVPVTQLSDLLPAGTDVRWLTGEVSRLLVSALQQRLGYIALQNMDTSLATGSDLKVTPAAQSEEVSRCGETFR